MKQCKVCNEVMRFGNFYKSSITSKGNQSYSSTCRRCTAIKRNPSGKYNPHKKMSEYEIRDTQIVEHNSLYILLKKVSLNDLKVSYIDAMRLLSYYIDLFGDDIPDYYTEKEQLDIAFFRLNDYIKTLQA